MTRVLPYVTPTSFQCKFSLYSNKLIRLNRQMKMKTVTGLLLEVTKNWRP